MSTQQPGFFARIGLSLRVLFNSEAAARVAAPEAQPVLAPVAPAPSVPLAPAALPPERQHASALALLGLLQREGRLIDFLREDIAAFTDADIGAAVRVVHAGCRKSLDQYLRLEPAQPGAEGDAVNLPSGYDAQRVRLVGNVGGQAPFRGTLRHHGWVATEVRLPSLSEAIDPRVIAPAEVEL